MYNCTIQYLNVLLHEHFDVVSVVGNCDFKEQVEGHEPDMILFHSGIEDVKETGAVITNTNCYHEIPRAGYISQDSWTPSRLKSIHKLLAVGVTDVFGILRQDDYPKNWEMPLFCIPFFLDTTVYRDYGEEKVIPVSLTGAGWWKPQNLYPWRHKVGKVLFENYACFHSPSVSNSSNQLITGEKYARMLNRSFFSAGCGTVCKAQTLKLIELAGSKTCFVTEDTQVARNFGYEDMVNCVFADETSVVDKMNHLFENPEKLASVTDAGYRMVHENHIPEKRTQLIEWLELKRRMEPGERIIQPDAFGPLQLVGHDFQGRDRIEIEPTFVSQGIAQGYQLMETMEYQQAIDIFVEIHKIFPWMSEPKFGIAYCLMASGQIANAEETLLSNLQFAQQFSFPLFDPFDQALMGLVFLRNNKAGRAFEILRISPNNRSPFLNAVRWWCMEKYPEEDNTGLVECPRGDERINVHTLYPMKHRSFEEWLELIDYLMGEKR